MICLIANSLLKKMVNAIPEAIVHRRAFEEFDTCLRKDKSSQVDEWAKLYAQWDKKPTNSPCIFDTTEPSAFPVYLITISLTDIFNRRDHGERQAGAS